VWNAVRWAFGSSTPVKETFGPRDIFSNTTFMIARENGMGRALSGTGGARSSAAQSHTCCKSLRSSSLALCNFAFVHSGSCYFCLESAHHIQDLLRDHIIPLRGCPPLISSCCSSRAPHIAGLDSLRNYEWDLVLTGPTVGAKMF